MYVQAFEESLFKPRGVTTTTDRYKCIEFIDKVREARFIKVKRLVNKFNRLVNKGRGMANAHSSNKRTNNNRNSNQAQDLDTSSSSNNNQLHTLETNDK